MRACFAVPTATTVFGVRRDGSQSLQHQKVAKKSSQHHECSLRGRIECHGFPAQQQTVTRLKPTQPTTYTTCLLYTSPSPRD